MKKKIFIALFVILTCFPLGFGGWKAYDYWKTQQIIIAQKKAWEEDCKYWLDGIAEVRVPAPVGGIYKALMNTSNCVLNETEKFTTKEQFAIYLKIIEDMKELEDYALYYKAGGNYPTDVEYYFLIIFQSVILNKLTNDKQYEVINPYPINCELEKNTIEPPMCLYREVLKICNIESRRHIKGQLRHTSELVYNFFQTITNDQPTLQQWMKEFYNLIQLFVEMVKADDILMDPIYSDLFMRDWGVFRVMNGIEIEEVSEVPKPYPLPFP